MKKSIISLILILCLTVNLIPILGTEITVSAANSISTNLLKGKTVWQTATGWGHDSIKNAVDGSTSTEWNPGGHSADGTATVYMDLGSSVKYNKIKVHTTQWNSSEISLSSSSALSGTHSISNNVSTAKLSSATTLFTEKFSPAKVYKTDGATAGSGVTLPSSVTAASTYERIFPTSTNRYLSLYNRVAATGINGNKISEIELYYAPPSTMSIDINTTSDATHFDNANFDKTTNTYLNDVEGTTDKLLQLRAWLYDSEGDSLTNDAEAFKGLTWWLGNTEGTMELNGIKLCGTPTGQRFVTMSISPSAKSSQTKINCKWTQNGYTTLTASLILTVTSSLDASLTIADFGDGTEADNNTFTAKSGTAFTKNNLITRGTKQYSGQWTNITTDTTIKKTLSSTTSFTPYDYVNLWVYSKDATGADIGVMLYSESDSYFRRQFKLDWAGWKMVSLPFSNFSSNSKNGVAPSWSKITGFGLTSSGWSSVAPTTSDFVCIDTVKVTKTIPEYEKPYEFDLVNMNNSALITSVGGTANTTYTKNAKYSFAWGDMTKKGSIKFTNVPRDWTTFDHIQFSIYSEAKTTEAIKFIVDADAHEATSSSYFTEDIKIDWQGWKTFTYRTLDITPARTAQLDAINSITFAANGWGLTASSEPRIYIDSITAYKYPEHYGSALPFKYDTRSTFDEIKSSVKAMAYGSNNVIVNGNIRTVDAKVRKINGVIHAPASVFTAYGYTIPDTVKTTVLDGVTYYPATEALAAAGKAYWLSPDEMIVISSNANIAKIRNTEDLTDYIHYMMTYKDVTLTDSDIAEILANLKDYYAGTNITEVPENYTILADYITRINGDTKTYLNTINMTDKTKDPFDVSSGTVNAHKARIIYEKTLNPAVAYANPLSNYYHNEDLKNAIIYALDWARDKYFGEGTMESGRTGDWFHWEIAAPRALCKVLICMSDILTKSQIDSYLYPVNYLVPRSYYTMANKADQVMIVLMAGVLQKDSEKIIGVRDSLDTIFRYQENSGDGFYRDGSFIQHTWVPYIFAYGSSLFEGVVPPVVILSGTKAELVNPQSKNVYRWVFDSVQPFVFNGCGMDMLSGRCISMSYAGMGSAILLPLMPLVNSAEDIDKVNLKAFIKSFSTELVNYQATRLDTAGLYRANILHKVLSDPDVADISNYSLTKAYPMMDRVIKNTPEYAVGISMNSARISAYESINGDNMKGWYANEGAVYIYTNGNYPGTRAKPGSYGKEFMDYGNTYRIPGTTVDTQERPVVSVQGAQSWLSDERFVGGVTLDEKYSTAAMKLDAFSHTGATSTSQYNGSLPYFDCDLEAKKSWFIFDDEVVCMGADITSTKDKSVETTVENMRHSMSDTVTVDGTEVASTGTSSTKTFANSEWAHIDGIGGYVFPYKDKTLNVRRYNNTYDFTEMWFDHGKNPSGERYTYVILPTMTAEETKEYSENRGVLVNVNNASIQSVYDKSTNSTGTVFWRADTYKGVTTDQPLIAMQNSTDGVYTFSIADPTQNLTSATITLDNGLLVPIEASENVKITKMGNKIKLTYNLTNSKGASYTVKFKDYTNTEYSSGLIFEANSTDVCEEFAKGYDTSTKLNYSQTALIDGTSGSGLENTRYYATNVDYSTATHMNMWINSKNVTGSKVNILLFENQDTTYYAYYYLPVDWTGWKLVSIPLSDFKFNKAEASMANMKYIMLNTSGWKGVAGFDDTAESLAKIQLYVDKIWLSNSAKSTLKSHKHIYSNDNGNISTNVNIENTGVEDKIVRIIVAKYDVYDKLISAEFKDVTVKTGEVITPTIETVVDDGQITTVKTFVWNDLTSITPLGIFGIFNLN